MTHRNQTPKGAALDQALATAEDDPTSHVLQVVRRHVQPHPEFAHRLEAQLWQTARTRPRAARSGTWWLRLDWQRRQLTLAGVAALLLLALGGWLLVKRPHPSPPRKETIPNRGSITLIAFVIVSASLRGPQHI